MISGIGLNFSGPGLWYATRATGLVTLLLLTASVVLGILTAARVTGPAWPRFLTIGLHRNLSLLVLVFLALHVGTTVVDSYTPISLADAFAPFMSSYKTFWLGLGAVAADLIVALAVTSLLRQRIGHRAWRAVHWCGYLCWPLALVHGAGIGTDAARSWDFYLTIGCVAAAAGALAVRVITHWPDGRLLRLGVVVAIAGCVLSAWSMAARHGL
jgi:methionine sulfoxide reductase heme-binding subunit